MKHIKNVRFGLSSAIFFHKFEEIFRLAEKFGIGVEIMPFRWQYNAVIKLTKKHPDVKVLGFHAPFCYGYRDFLAAALRKPPTIGSVFNLIWAPLLGPARKSPAITLAEDLGGYINFHPNSFFLPNDRSGLRKRCFVENPTSMEDGYAPADVKIIVDEHSVSATFDTSHAGEKMILPGMFLAAYKTMKPRIIHLSDSMLGQTQKHLVPGDGNLPLRKLLRLFAEKAKMEEEEHYIIIELGPIFGKEKREEAIRRSLKFIKEALE